MKAVGQAKIAKDEVLVRAFFRDESETDILDELMLTDFRRRRKYRSNEAKESGISCWRGSRMTEQQIINRILKDKPLEPGRLMGFAECSLDDLGGLALKYRASSEHVTLLCASCDESKDPVCQPVGLGDKCAILSRSESELPKALSKLFKVTSVASEKQAAE